MVSVSGIVREQKIRANKENINGIFMGTSRDFGGHIPGADIKEQSTSKSRNVKSDVRTFGTEKDWEIIQEFSPYLPYKPYSTLIPGWYLLLVSGLPHNNILVPSFLVTRIMTVVWVDEFNKPESHWHLEGKRYPLKSLTVEVEFHPTKRPIDRSVKAWYSAKNGITQFDLDKDIAQPMVYKTYIPNLRNDSIRIFWEF